MNAPRKLVLPTRRVRGAIRILERRFHERAFGEELARINLDFTEAQRRDYLGWMRRTARAHGIDSRKQSVHAWMDRLEEEIDKEEKTQNHSTDL